MKKYVYSLLVLLGCMVPVLLVAQELKFDQSEITNWYERNDTVVDEYVLCSLPFEFSIAATGGTQKYEYTWQLPEGFEQVSDTEIKVNGTPDSLNILYCKVTDANNDVIYKQIHIFKKVSVTPFPKVEVLADTSIYLYQAPLTTKVSGNGIYYDQEKMAFFLRPDSAGVGVHEISVDFPVKGQCGGDLGSLTFAVTDSIPLQIVFRDLPDEHMLSCEPPISTEYTVSGGVPPYDTNVDVNGLGDIGENTVTYTVTDAIGETISGQKWYYAGDTDLNLVSVVPMYVDQNDEPFDIVFDVHMLSNRGELWVETFGPGTGFQNTTQEIEYNQQLSYSIIPQELAVGKHSFKFVLFDEFRCESNPVEVEFEIITEQVPLSISFDRFSLQSNNNVCFGAELVRDYTVTGGKEPYDVTVNWESIDVNTPGTYNCDYSVTDDDGIKIEGSFTVEVLEEFIIDLVDEFPAKVSTSADKIEIFLDDAGKGQISSSSSVLSWMAGTALLSYDTEMPFHAVAVTPSGLPIGTHTINISAWSTTGCESNILPIEFEVVEAQEMTINSNNNIDDYELCEGTALHEEISFIPSGGTPFEGGLYKAYVNGEYTETAEFISVIITELSEETTVMFEDAVGNTVSKTITVTLHKLPLLEIENKVIDGEGKHELSATVSGSSVYQYQWSTGESIHNIVVDESGVYSVTVTDENGCVAVEQIDVLIDECQITGEFTFSEINQGQYTFAALSEGDYYKWTIDGETVSNEKNFMHNFDRSGTYEVNLLISLGQECKAHGNDTIRVFEEGCTVTGEYATFEINKNQYVFEALYEADTYKWWVDAELVSEEKTLSYTFETAGKHSVDLFVTQGQDCGVGTSDTITVESECPITGEFTKTEINTNQYTFEAASEADAYVWNIDGKLVSTEKSFTHYFESEGEYVVELVVNQGQMCQERGEETIVVSSECTITGEFIITELEGATYKLEALSEADAYIWHIDGKYVSSVFNKKSFTYRPNYPGTYEVSLMVTKGQNCKEYGVDTLRWFEDGCDVTAEFTTTRIGDNQYVFEALYDADSYSWTRDVEVISTERRFTHTFTDEFVNDYNPDGRYVIGLTVENGQECSTWADDTISVPYVYDCSLNATFTYVEANENYYIFTATAKDDYYEWKIDDKIVSTERSFGYVLDEEGEHDIQLRVHDNKQCEEFGNETVFVEPACSITGDFTITEISRSEYKLESVSEGDSYSWNIEGEYISQSSNEKSFVFEPNMTGTFYVSFMVAQGQYCKEYGLDTIRFFEDGCNVTAEFKTTKVGKDEYVFEALYDAGSYTWRRDGEVISSDKRFTQTFTDDFVDDNDPPGVYVISLVVEDGNECIIATTDTIAVPEDYTCSASADFTFYEANDGYYIFTASSDEENYEWRIAGKKVSEEKSFGYTVGELDKYPVELYVHDNKQCGAIAYDTVYVGSDICAITGDFTITELEGATYKLEALSEADAYTWHIHGKYVSYLSHAKSFTYRPNYPGTYDVSLVVTKGQNCKEYGVDTLRYFEDGCDVTAEFTTTRIGDNQYVFEALYDADSYSWTRDVDVISTERRFTHTFTDEFVYDYNPDGRYVIGLTVENGQECSTWADDTITIPDVDVCFVSADFTYYKLNDNDYVFTASTDEDNYVWKIADEIVSNERSFSYTFSEFDDYLIELYVSDDKQCEDYSKRIVSVSDGNDCDLNAQFSHYESTEDYYMFIALTDADFYEWKIAGEVVSNEKSFGRTITEAGEYPVELRVVAENQCEDYAYGTVKVLGYDLLSIKGTVKDCNGPVACGHTVAYKKIEGVFTPVDTVTIMGGGKYEHHNLSPGIYTVMAVPCDDENYSPFYFVNADNIDDAIEINLDGNAESVDIIFGQCVANGTNDEISSISIYPNPVVSESVVENIPENADKISVVSALGRTVAEKPINSNRIEISKSEIPSGTYIVLIWSEGAIVAKGRIIVK